MSRIRQLGSYSTLGQVVNSFSWKRELLKTYLLLRGLPQSWSTSNGTFAMDKMCNIEIAFVDFSNSTKVHLASDLVEYKPGLSKPMYDLIIDKNTMHYLGVVLDFKESTIQIDNILLPMRDITNLQLKKSITQALRSNSSHAQEPVST